MSKEQGFDLCAICKNNGTDECGSCGIRHACFNGFQPDESKVIINPKTRLYAHWVNCIKEKCYESSGGKCNRAKFIQGRCEPAPYPEDGKCLFPNYFPYSKEDEENKAFEQVKETDGIPDDTPF